MISELLQLAAASGAKSEPGFTSKKVQWVLVLVGGTPQLLPFGTPSKKGKWGNEIKMAPELTQPEFVTLGKGSAHFLVETLGVVLGLEDVEDPEGSAKTLAKHAGFVQLLRDARTVCPVLDDFIPVLSSDGLSTLLLSDSVAGLAKSTDKVALAVITESGVECLAERSDWHEWWRGYRRRIRPLPAAADLAPKMICLASGSPISAQDTHPKIKGLKRVGGLGSGDALISYDKPAFQSYGLVKGENGALSETSAVSYRETLNELLDNSRVDLPKSVMTYWYSGEVAEKDNPLAWLSDGDSAQDKEASALAEVERLKKAIFTGERPELGSYRYFMANLSGASGRVMVRDFREGKFDQLVHNLQSWFRDREVEAPGARRANGASLRNTIASLVRKDDDISPELERKLLISAVAGGSLPDEILNLAVRRTRLFLLMKPRDDPQSYGLESYRQGIRLGLLKAYWIRKRINMIDVPVAASDQVPSVAYQCGRLMGVLAQLQEAADPEVKADIVARYYSAASTTPALVLGRLLRLSNFHLDKVRTQKGKGLAVWFQHRISDLAKLIGASAPRTLSLQDQSLFGLGFFQEQAKKAAPSNEAEPVAIIT